MVENAPKHLPYQSSPEYKWKEEEEEEARRDLHTARKRRVATLRRADPEDYEILGEV